jgi:hypothetical protein
MVLVIARVKTDVDACIFIFMQYQYHLFYTHLSTCGIIAATLFSRVTFALLHREPAARLKIITFDANF